MLLSPSNQQCRLRKPPFTEEDYEIWLTEPQKIVSEPWVRWGFFVTLFLTYFLDNESENLTKRYKAIGWIFHNHDERMMWGCEERNIISNMIYFISSNLMAFLHSGTDRGTRMIYARQWSYKGACCLSSCQGKCACHRKGLQQPWLQISFRIKCPVHP